MWAFYLYGAPSSLGEQTIKAQVKPEMAHVNI